MELNRYVQIALARWYDIVLLMLIALAGTFTYLQWNATSTARTTVAVLEPVVANPLGAGAALVSFPDIAKSTIVAERVSAALDGAVTPGEVNQSVNVTLGRSMVQNTTIPLYSVTVQHEDKEMALKLAEAVVKEAHIAFVEINSFNPVSTLEALDELEADVRATAVQTRQDLADFEAENNAYQITRLIEGQLAVENGLRVAGLQAEGSQSQVAAVQGAVGASLSEARGQLGRFRSLKSEYSDLQFQLGLAASAVSQGEARGRDFALTGSDDLRNAASGQLAKDRERLAEVQRLLQEFERRNRIANFDAEFASQLGLVAELERQQTALAGGATPEVAAARLKTEQEETARLYLLLPEYERLSRAVFTALGQLDSVERRRLDWRLAASMPISSYVKPLDSPTLQSDFLLQVLFYALASVAGLVAGLLLVYVIAYFDRIPRSVEDVEELLGIPTLGRVPQIRR